MAAIYSIQGNVEASLNAMQTTIKNLNDYLKENEPQVKKNQAQTFLFQAIDNCAGIYKDIGDYGKAKELLEYAYQQKSDYLGAKNIEVTKAKVLLGQIYLSLKEFKKAESHLNQGILEFESYKKTKLCKELN